MIGKNASDKEAVSLAEVAEMLEKRKGDGELGYEQNVALEHAKKFSIDKAKLDKAEKKLKELGLARESIIKILDISPTSVVVARYIISKEMGSFEEEDINKILAIVKDSK